MNTKFNIKSVIPLLIAGVFILSSCKDELWVNHYQPQQVSNQTLMEAIDANPDLSKFAAILHKTGYDSILSSSQTYTVWAPTNDALTEAIDTDTINRFIENHICRFNYSTADLLKKPMLRIRMLNGKANTFTTSGSNFIFGDANLDVHDLITKNGVLHTLKKQVVFFQNTWEYLKSTSGLDSVGNYLKSYDVNLFDAASSTEIGTSPEGIVYDSVFLYSNDWLARHGRLYLEDSVYTTIAPDNSAWNEAYDRIKTYFTTYDVLKSETATTKTFALTGTVSDSLRKVHTVQTIVQDLVFRGNLENIPGDSLISTNGNVFYSPAYLFSGAEKIRTSNGLIYKTSVLNHKALESYHKSILVEAERSTGREFANASLYTRVTNNDRFISLISDKKYIELIPTSTNPNFQPEVTLEIPNTLSAKYNIYCVCVPAFDRDTAKVLDSKTGLYRYTNDSTKVSFQLTYVGADGVMKTNTAITKDPATNLDFVTSPLKMSKFLIAKAFKFPFANYTASPFWNMGTKLTTVKIKVKTNVTNAEFTAGKFTRNLRVDSFILEPVNE